MSRKGNCWDNAVAESFFHTIKTQLIHHCKFQNVAGAKQALFNYIEVTTIGNGSIRRMAIGLRLILSWYGGTIEKWLNPYSTKLWQDHEPLQTCFRMCYALNFDLPPV